MPLLMEHGRDVTTRQIADAAGVAEGTIFRVFPSKDALVDAALAQAFDPTALIVGLRAIDADLPLRERLVQAVDVIQERFFNVFALMTSVGLVHPPAEHARARTSGGSRGSWPAPVLELMVDLITPDAEALRCSPHELARLLRLLTFSGSHRMIADGALLTPAQIVDVVLYGVTEPRSADGSRSRATGRPHSSTGA